MIPTSQSVSGATSGDPIPRAKQHQVMEIVQRCHVAGLRMTDQRRIIVRALVGKGGHPNVEELYHLAAAIDRNISISTVYRTVRRFEDLGILSRLDFGGARSRYEPVGHGTHYHIVDVETGAVTEFQNDELDALLVKTAARLGFTPVSHRLELFGKRNSKYPKSRSRKV